MRRFTIAFSLTFLALLAVDAYPGLRGGAGWRWPYRSPEHWAAVIMLVVVVVVYLLGVAYLRQRSGAMWLHLAWIVLGGTILGFAVAGIQSGDAAFTLFTRTVSPVQTGASTVAVREMAQNGIQATFEAWPRVMRGAREANIIHFTTSPPGQPLIHIIAARLTENLPGAADLSMRLREFQCADPAIMAYSRGELVSVALIGMLMPLWAALAAIPIYFAAVNLSGDRKTALRVAAWWPLVPTVLMFAPTWNTVYPTLAAGSFALLLAGIKGDLWKRKALLLTSAGLLMSVATFLNFAVMPIILFFGLYSLFIMWFVMKQPRQAVITGVWFGVGLLSMWLIFWLISGLTPLDLASVTADQHSDLVAGRDYLAWLLLHPYDTLMFIGWPLVGLWLMRLTPIPDPSPITMEEGRRTPHRSIFDSPIGILAVSLLITIILVDVAGVVQGENARIMSFYAPFVLLAGTSLLHRSLRWDLPLLAMQGLTVIVMASVLPVVPLDLNPPPAGPSFEIARLETEALTQVNATFNSDAHAGAFTLTDYRFIADVGQQLISLETIWNGSEQVERPYQFEVIAQAENDIDGQIITEPQLWMVQGGLYPPTCWQAADTVHDLTIINLPLISAPVEWMLELRAVDPRTGDVMQVTLPDGTQADHVALGSVKYP